MQAVYYRDSHGFEPVDNFINSLPRDHQLSIDSTIDLLNRLSPIDPPLPFPHSSHIIGQLRELRCHHGRTLYRILYQRSENLFVLLHSIEKRRGALPEEDIAIAQKRWDDFKVRMDTQNRQPPRAAGRDAPS